jgi:2-methylcitrate dehydratase PrpD
LGPVIDQPGGLDRRDFIKLGAAAGASAAGLAAIAAPVREAFGQPLPIPAESRTVEAGLALFAQRWRGAGAIIATTHYGQFVADKVFNCRVAGQPRSFVLRLASAGSAELTPGVDPFRHADMILSEEDWLGVLYGDYSGLAPLMDGALFPARDGANKVALLGIFMYTFAHLPAGSTRPDPELLVRSLAGLAQYGLPACQGSPSTTDELDGFQQNPERALRDAVQPPNSVPPVTRRYAEFTAGLRYEQLPPGTVLSAKEQILGTLGAMYAGSRMEPGRKFARAVRGFGDRAEASIVGRDSFRTSARHAALLNSVHAQILDWDDWVFIAHSGAAVVPAALAAAELGRASGRELIAAVVAGNEILARTGEVLTDVLHAGNAMPTHQIEVPLVAGRLLGLGVEQLQDAVGIACTQPQVTSIPAWTADAKGLLSGWPVLTGVEAALFARAGISGRRDIVESPAGYAYRVSEIASPARLERLVDGLGTTWRFDSSRHELFTKRYPVDGFQITAAQAVLELAKELRGTPRERLPDQVRRLSVRIPWTMAATATMMSRGGKEIYERIRTRPDWTYMPLIFDGKYPLAAALAEGRLTWREYRPKVIFDPVVQALIDRIELVPDLAMGGMGAEARLELADGRSLVNRQDCVATGFPVREKLDVGAEGLLSKRQIAAIVKAVDRLERFADVREFMKVAVPRLR